jgi:hypothetical protein
MARRSSAETRMVSSLALVVLVRFAMTNILPTTWGSAQPGPASVAWTAATSSPHGHGEATRLTVVLACYTMPS